MPIALNITSDTIESARNESEMSGDRVVFKFKNGATLKVCSENDVVLYFAPGQDPDSGQAVCFGVDMGAGHHTPGEGPQMWSTNMG